MLTHARCRQPWLQIRDGDTGSVREVAPSDDESDHHERLHYGCHRLSNTVGPHVTPKTRRQCRFPLRTAQQRSRDPSPHALCRSILTQTRHAPQSPARLHRSIAAGSRARARRPMPGARLERFTVAVCKSIVSLLSKMHSVIECIL